MKMNIFGKAIISVVAFLYVVVASISFCCLYATYNKTNAENTSEYVSVCYDKPVIYFNM